MKFLKHKVTLKILIGYLILGASSAFFGALVLSEIKTFTKLQAQDFTNKSEILNIGSLIADIYESESLARAAIQLNSSTKFSEYQKENERLYSKLDSLHFFTNDSSQEFIFDSIKVVLRKKFKNIADLKKVKSSYDSEVPINTVINKLSSIDSLVNKAHIDEIKREEELQIQTRMKFKKFKKTLDKKKPRDSVDIEQIQIDSLLSVSKGMLKKAQKEKVNQRAFLLRKERELIRNDIIISRKLRELLTTLKTGIIEYTNALNKQREKTINRSRNILLFAAVISLLIIVFFSVTFLNDFWKNQRYRKELEQANQTAASLLKSREQLISMVSHDLRTPLSTISGYSELLQKSSYHTKAQNYVAHIRSASAYMNELVNDLMEFSKVESGAISLKSIPFDLQKNIDEIVLSAQSLIQNKPVSLVAQHDAKITNLIVSDPFKIKQILNNLIANACKFTNKGTVEVKTTLALKMNKYVLKIAVKDSGIGIPKDEQEKVFKAFTQLDNPKAHSQSGFGLGLAISKKLVTLLKGTLTLQSEEGIGSEFVLNLPVQLSEKTLKTTQQFKKAAVFNLRAIVVEDDASLRQLLADILEQYHIKSHVFADAKAAVGTLDILNYDLVLTDIQLPKMNGIHFMEVIKSHKNYNNQPIIAMTGRLNLSKEDYLNSGFSGVLAKPFQTQELQEILCQFFDSSLYSIPKDVSSVVVAEKEEFCTASLKMFLEDDRAIRKTLAIFLEETRKNRILLKKAKQRKDIPAVNTLSHTMLGMFKQLKVHQVVPFLENFETIREVDESVYNDFDKALGNFIKSLANHLN